jgi:hypothetical protein
MNNFNTARITNPRQRGNKKKTKISWSYSAYFMDNHFDVTRNFSSPDLIAIATFAPDG